MSKLDSISDRWFVLSNELEDENEDAILEGESEYLERIDVSFSEGELLPIEHFMLPIEVEVYEYALRGTMTDLLSFDDISGPVISKRTKEVFDELGILEVQYFPLKIRDSFSNVDQVYSAQLKKKQLDFEEKEYKGYFIANFYGKVDCIDHELSELEYFRVDFEIPEGISDQLRCELEVESDRSIDLVRSLVLDEAKTPDQLAFRLQDREEILVFDRRVVEKISETQLSGFVFTPLREYSEEIPDDQEDEDSD